MYKISNYWSPATVSFSRIVAQNVFPGFGQPIPEVNGVIQCVLHNAHIPFASEPEEHVVLQQHGGETFAEIQRRLGASPPSN